MPVDESRYVCCKDCKRGPKYKEYDPEGACSAGWKARNRKTGCYIGERIEGTMAKKGEQGYVRPAGAGEEA